MQFMIYKITCLINGKAYVGLTRSTLDGRWKTHLSASRRKGRRAQFLIALAKYGPDNFIREVLTVVATLEEAARLEIEYICALETQHPNGYNLSKGGEGASYKRSDEARRNMSEAAKRKFTNSPALRAQYAERLKRRWKEDTAFIDVTMRGSYKSKPWGDNPERRAAHSARLKGNTNSVGRVMPEDIRKQKSELMKRLNVEGKVGIKTWRSKS